MSAAVAKVPLPRRGAKRHTTSPSASAIQASVASAPPASSNEPAVATATRASSSTSKRWCWRRSGSRSSIQTTAPPCAPPMRTAATTPSTASSRSRRRETMRRTGGRSGRTPYGATARGLPGPRGCRRAGHRDAAQAPDAKAVPLATGGPARDDRTGVGDVGRRSLLRTTSWERALPPRALTESVPRRGDAEKTEGAGRAPRAHRRCRWQTRRGRRRWQTLPYAQP